MIARLRLDTSGPRVGPAPATAAGLRARSTIVLVDDSLTGDSGAWPHEPHRSELLEARVGRRLVSARSALAATASNAFGPVRSTLVPQAAIADARRAGPPGSRRRRRALAEAAFVPARLRARRRLIGLLSVVVSLVAVGALAAVGAGSTFGAGGRRSERSGAVAPDSSDAARPPIVAPSGTAFGAAAVAHQPTVESSRGPGALPASVLRSLASLPHPAYRVSSVDVRVASVRVTIHGVDQAFGSLLAGLPGVVAVTMDARDPGPDGTMVVALALEAAPERSGVGAPASDENAPPRTTLRSHDRLPAHAALQRIAGAARADLVIDRASAGSGAPVSVTAAGTIGALTGWLERIAPTPGWRLDWFSLETGEASRATLTLVEGEPAEAPAFEWPASDSPSLARVFGGRLPEGRAASSPGARTESAQPAQRDDGAAPGPVVVGRIMAAGATAYVVRLPEPPLVCIFMPGTRCLGWELVAEGEGRITLEREERKHEVRTR